jgi:predicted AlkP superfamily phosphohydrolase/phosphomutase
LGAEYHDLREKIIADLRKATYPVDGKPLFDWVEPRENVYSGEYMDSAPDIMFSLRGYRAVVGEDAELPLMGPWSQPRAGYHRREGILVLNGPMIQAGGILRNARIEDVAPTILTCCGLAFDEDMDGDVLNDALRPGFLEAVPPRRERFAESRSVAGAKVCREDSEEMEDLLKGLGYLN